MNKVFDIYLARKDLPDSEAFAELTLPASPYQLLDAYDKIRMEKGADLYWEITGYRRFEELSTVLGEDCSILDLNALAEKLSELDDTQAAAFAGLLKIEEKKHRPIPIARLVDLACDTGCCHVMTEVQNDSQLGRFCAENGFLPELDDLPDAVFELLDFERIGREHRLREGGVFTAHSKDHPGGYVEQHDEPKQVYKDMDLTLKMPDYSILLEVSKDFRKVLLRLPASPEALNGVLEATGARDWREVFRSCLDCRIPEMTEWISDSDESIHHLNLLAQMLADMAPRAMVMYKALLQISNYQDLFSAERLRDTLYKYILSPEFSSPVELAKEELSTILCEPAMTLITPYVNLRQYGEALIRDSGGVISEYGLIERIDGHPILGVRPQPRQGEMEMK